MHNLFDHIHLCASKRVNSNRH